MSGISGIYVAVAPGQFSWNIIKSSEQQIPLLNSRINACYFSLAGYLHKLYIGVSEGKFKELNKSNAKFRLLLVVSWWTKRFQTFSSIALISFPHESHWSPLASYRRKKLTTGEEFETSSERRFYEAYFRWPPFFTCSCAKRKLPHAKNIIFISKKGLLRIKCPVKHEIYS